MPSDINLMLRLLRNELTAVHQQFFHMLALRQWQRPDILERVTEIDNEDFQNAMDIIEFLVTQGADVGLPPHRFRPGSDAAGVLRAEDRMEAAFAEVLDGAEAADAQVGALLRRAAAPRPAYRDWLKRQIDEEPGDGAFDRTPPCLADFTASLIALVEQPMLHAFRLWLDGHRVEADNAWRLSGAAMLYGTAIVRRGALENAVPAPSEIPGVEMAYGPEAAFEADFSLVRRAAGLGVKAGDEAEAYGEKALARLCRRIAAECDSIDGMDPDGRFPDGMGRSPVFDSFGKTRKKHLGAPARQAAE